MDNFLIDTLRDLPNTDFNNLSGLISSISLKKNQIYFQEGSQNNKIFYIKKGLIRAYTFDTDGNEITAFFRWQKEFGADPNTFFKKSGARYTWVAIEDSEILEISQEKIEQLSKRNVGFLKMRIRMQRRLMERLTERLESFIFLSPEERFAQMLKEFPDLCERIPDKHLSSFLGITPVSLSRIKKRVLN